MACAQQCAAEYLENARPELVTHLQNLPLIIENLYQRSVFNVYEVDSLKAEKTDFDKARFILDSVYKKGESASYELLRILDVTRKRTLHPDLHIWISCFPFREDAEADYCVGTNPCHSYQNQLKKKAQNILKRQWEQCSRCLKNKSKENFTYIPVVLDTDTEVNSVQNKLKVKNKKCKKPRSKKLRSFIPEQKQKLTPEDLLVCKGKTFLLIGKPGIGKTSVALEMLSLWFQKDDRDLDYMFYFDEATLGQISNPTSLESLLFDLYCKPLEKDRQSVLQDIEENSENVIIVFDSISTLQNNSTVKKIMNCDLLPEAKIVLTCSSEPEEDSFFSGRTPCIVYVKGFSKQSVYKYFERMVGSDSELLDLLLNNQELISLCHVPMYAFMVATCILFRNPTSLKCSVTVTEMYVHILRQDLKKAGNKTSRQVDKYLKDMRDQIFLLMKSAFKATLQKTVNLPNIDSDDIEISKAFLKTLTVEDTPTSVEKFHAFPHSTVQEFFSALWLLGNPGEIDRVLKLCVTEEQKHLKHVIPFLCGLLSKQNLKLLKNLFLEEQIKRASDQFFIKLLDTFLQPQTNVELMDEEDLDVSMCVFVCQCLYESQSPEVCLLFLEKVKYHLDLSGNDLDPHQCCAVSYVISQSSERQVELSLEDCSISDTGIQMILRSSPYLRCKSLILYHIWMSVLDSKRPDFTALLDVCGKQMHLPVLGKTCIYRKAEKIIRDSSEKVNLHLHCREDILQLSDDLCNVVFQTLPQINSIRLYCREESGVLLFLIKLIFAAAERDVATGQIFTKLLTSVCSYTTFPFDDSSESRSFLHCLHCVTQLSFIPPQSESEEFRERVNSFLLDLCLQAALHQTENIYTTVEKLMSYAYTEAGEFLLDLYSHVKSYEIQTGKSVLPALQPFYQSAPVSFFQCLPYITRQSFRSPQSESDAWRTRVNSFLLDLCLQAALHQKENISTTVEELMSCTYGREDDFLLDLFSNVKNYQIQTGRNVLPALQPVYQSVPAVWNINLSEKKISLFLEVLKLQTVKKPVVLRGWSDEESEVRSFLQCLPFISQLSFECFKGQTAFQFLVKLTVAAADCDAATGQSITKLLISVCTYTTFPFYEDDDEYDAEQSDFLLDLFSHVKNYETQTGRNVLPALQPVYQSVPAVWNINLSERKISLFLEVLKLQTVKKPVVLSGWSDEESEVRSFLQCLPFISQLRFSFWSEHQNSLMFLNVLIKAAESERQTGEKTLELLTSVCTYRSFPFGDTISSKQSDFLLDLFSLMKNYETQTGRNVLPALQPVYQSAPAVWNVNHSERKISLFLEVLKLQTVKKPVELRGWSDEESEVRSFLQCLPFISQLRFSFWSENQNPLKFLNVLIKAAENERHTGEKTLELLTSVCTYSSFPFGDTNSSFPFGDTNSFKQSDFLLDLFSLMKNYETQTGRNVLPALQPVYQSVPPVWIINLSEKKISLFLEVLKLQTVKKPVELRGWSDEESEVRSFLQCLPYISQLSFRSPQSESDAWRTRVNSFLLDLCLQAALHQKENISTTVEELMSCTYGREDDFLLDLFSHVKNYETQTGRNVLPALQPVYQSAPAVWIINLSERKISLFLEVLKLQTVKKPVVLRGWSDEESEVRSFLQCLPFISQLSGDERSVQSLCKVTQCKVTRSRKEAEQVSLLLQALNFTLSLGGKLSTSSCRSVGQVLGFSSSSLNLTLNPQTVSLRGSRLLFRHLTHIHTLRLNGVMMVRMVRALREMRAPAPVTVKELSLVLNRPQWSEGELSRVLSSLASLLRLWNVQCVNLTEHTMEVQSLTVLLCHQGSLTIRLSQETLQQLVVLVYEAQEEEFTRCFLQKVGGDLTSCSLNWEMIQYFLQFHTVTVDFRRSNIKEENIRQLLPLLDRVQLRRLSSSFVLSIIRAIYETNSVYRVSSLLNLTENCINLNSRELNSVHCAALRFTLQHCTAVSLSLLWTSIPEGELESIVPLLSHISHLSVDRLLLMRLLHCCSVSEGTAAAALLSALQHKLDFSCSSTLDLTAHTDILTLSTEDCRVISITIQRADTNTELILQDCEIEETGVEQLFTILHTVRLNCSKALLLQFLARLLVGTELECLWRALALSQAVGEELDLSHTQLDLQACRALGLFLEHSEGLSELDLSQCQLSDQCLELLLPNLHKTHILDLSNNDITDQGVNKVYSVLFPNSNVKTVRLFNNRITQKQLFMSDQRFEIW